MSERTQPSPEHVERHDPTWMHTGRLGRWCECSCGWTSKNGTVMFAQLAFGRHLLTSPTRAQEGPQEPADAPEAPGQVGEGQ